MPKQNAGDAILPSDALDEHHLRRLIEVSRTLISQRDLEALLHHVLEVARDLTGARYAALGILDGEQRELERFITLGIDEQTHEAIGALPRGRGVLGELIHNPKPLRLADVGEHPRSYGFPASHPPMSTFLGVPILVRGEAYGNLYITEKEQGEFDLADEQALSILANHAAIAIDNARLYEAISGRREELEHAVRGLEATTEIARALGGETELDRVLELIVKRGRALVDARALLIVLDEGHELVLAAAAGEVESKTVGKRLPIEASSATGALRSTKVERLPQLASNLRLSTAELGLTATSGLVVPLIFKGKRFGALAAFDRTVGGPEFKREDEELMWSFAAAAATAVYTAKSVADERLHHSITAAEQERRRWARELHDETLQSLAGLQVVLSSGLRRGSPEALAAAVRDAVDQISSEIDNLRNLITELRPAALDELGLQPAVEALAARTATIEGFAVDTAIDLAYGSGREPERLSSDLESAAYRLVQEALTNAAKHARPEKVEIELSEQDGTLELVVRDDGVGFDAGQPTGGFGIVGMRERVALAGGKFEVSSTPDGGTVVRVLLPVRGNEPRAEATGDTSSSAAAEL